MWQRSSGLYLKFLKSITQAPIIKVGLFLVLTHIRDQPLFIAWGVGGGLWGDYLIFRETKGGISCKLRTQRGESLKTLEGFRGGPLKFAWRMKTWGGGSRKSSNVIRGNHFSEVIFQWSNTKRGDRLNFTFFCPKSSVSPSPAINNDRSLNFMIRAQLLEAWLALTSV